MSLVADKFHELKMEFSFRNLVVAKRDRKIAVFLPRSQKVIISWWLP